MTLAPQQFHIPFRGFTLAELLISLALLGVIGTFVIPKILTSSQNAQYNTTAHEAASVIAAGFSQYKLQNQLTSSTKFGDLTPYLNYVKIDSSGTLINHATDTTSTAACDNANPCLILHNGGRLRYESCTFGGTTEPYAVRLMFDPDGIYVSGFQSIGFILYPTGRLASYGKMLNPTTTCGSSFGPVASWDPAWFSW